MANVLNRYLKERRQKILEVAARVFIDKGYATATMQETTTAWDLLPGTLCRYFAGKSDLIATVVGECMRMYRDVIVQVSKAAATPSEEFRLLGEHVAHGLPMPEWHDDCTLCLESYLAGHRAKALLHHFEGPLRARWATSPGSPARLNRVTRHTQTSRSTPLRSCCTQPSLGSPPSRCRCGTVSMQPPRSVS